MRRGPLGSIEQDEYVEIIVSLLRKAGGRARRQDVLAQIQDVLASQFRPPDYELLQSQHPPKERWVHNVDWAKRKLVEQGIIRSPSKSCYGTWVLSEEN